MESFDREKLKDALRKDIVKLYDVLNPDDEGFDLYKNALDGFSVSIEALLKNISLEEQMKLEKARQIQKSAQNIIGALHESAMTSIDGVERLLPQQSAENNKNKAHSELVDIVCHERKIIAEIKNKHNTVPAGNRHNVHEILLNVLSKYRGYTCYFVEVLPQYAKSYDIVFTPSNRETGFKVAENDKIRQIDGKSFYALLTGKPNALEELYMILPGIVAEIIYEENRIKLSHERISKSDVFLKNFNMAYDSEYFDDCRKQATVQKAEKPKLTKT